MELQEAYRRRPREFFTILKVQEWLEKVDEGWNEVLGHLGCYRHFWALQPQSNMSINQGLLSP